MAQSLAKAPSRPPVRAGPTYVDVYVDVGAVQDLDLAGDDLGHRERERLKAQRTEETELYYWTTNSNSYERASSAVWINVTSRNGLVRYVAPPTLGSLDRGRHAEPEADQNHSKDGGL